jgi:hypothetical protein
MKKVKLTRYYLWLLPLALLAVVGVVLVHPSRRVAAIGGYDLNDISGRYVSAETAYDISTSHIDVNGDYGAPVFFVTTAVMYVDGNGNVFGESDGFYGGTPPPGVNLGPSFFHGKYTIEPSSGRLTFKTCSYPGPFGASGTPCDTTGGATHPVYKTLVGYPAVLEDTGSAARTFTTVDQINNSDASQGGCCATTGYLVHARVWIRTP